MKSLLDALEIGILSINIQKNSIEIWNQPLLSLWQVNASLFTMNNAFSLLQTMAEQTDDPSLFLQQTSNPNPANFCREWRLSSGRYLELSLQPQADNYLFCFRDITRATLLETECLHQAIHDPLTGLPNKALLQDRITQALTGSAKIASQAGVLLVDINAFHTINNSMGPHVADALLQAVAKQLSQIVSESDTVARLEKDTFVLVFQCITREDLMLKANELLNILSKPVFIQEHSLGFSVNIGISVFPEDGQDTDTLLLNAHHALYQSKNIGKHQFQFYTAADSLRMRELLIADLPKAMHSGQFILHYQPLAELTGKTDTDAVEVHVYWNHPQHGLIHPSHFFPYLQENDYVNLGIWLLEAACQETRILRPLIVPVSAILLKQPDFVETAKKMLTQTGINPSLLILEIKENAILQDAGSVVETMLALKQFGIRWCLQDFSTGHATLSWLKAFPFDAIKLDNYIVKGESNAMNNAMVQAVCTMAKYMNLAVWVMAIQD